MKRRQEPKAVTAVAYYRVSSDRQEKEGFSIPAQQQLVREYAADRGMTVVREFAESETAKRAGRERFDEMVAYLKKNPSCRAILVEKTDRLYRNLKDYVTIDELGVEIHFVKENTVLSAASKSSEKFVHGIKLLVAKNYIDNLSEETVKGMDRKAQEGYYPTRAPLGYRNVMGPAGKRTIEPDPDYAPLVRNLFEWYAVGTLSLDRLVAKAHDAGFIYKKSRQPVARAAVHALLTNRMFSGKFLWKGELHEGNYEPLVTEELWLKVQDVLHNRGRKKPRHVKHDFAFARLVTCGHCGCALVGEIKKQKYVYYHCTGYRGKCPEPFVREEVLAACFTDVLRGLVFDDEVLELVRVALRESHRDVRAFHDEAVARLQAEYTKVQNRLDAAYTDKVDGVIDAGFFARKAAEWREEQQRLLAKVAEHQRANEHYMEEGVLLLDVVRRMPELFEKHVPKEKRRLLDFVLSNSTWAGGELTVEFRQPFDLLAVTNESLKREKAAGGEPRDLRPEKLPE